jgi:hypothetical protein
MHKSDEGLCATIKSQTTKGAKMKHGSLVNSVYSNGIALQLPPIGAPATICSWTDRSAATVFAIHKGNVVEVRDDITTRTDRLGMSDAQNYSYKTNVNGTRRHFRLRNGKFEAVAKGLSGRWVKFGSTAVIFGVRDAHHDFSF